MRAIQNARVILKDRTLENATVIFDKTILAAGQVAPPADCEITDGTGLTVTPGLLDLHIHGLLGKDFTDGIGEDNLLMAKKLPEFGVTGFLPTVMTVPRAQMEAAYEALRPLLRKDVGGARMLGIHSEGPFFCHKRKGAQDPNGIVPFDADWVLKYRDLIRLMSIAPELEGAEEFIRRIKTESEIVLAMGHTDADYLAARRAIALGVNHVTHLFNAMSPMNHREPGVAGTGLTSPEVTCELIADTFHVHPGLYEMITRAKGDKLCIITDCVRPGGLPDSEYRDGAGSRVIKKGVECRLEDGTIAGSVLTMDQGLKNLIRHSSLPLHKAVYAATAAPAAVIGEPGIGAILPGYDSDLVIWDKDWNVKQTVLKGETIYDQL